jgi:hypothetical protein
VFVYWHRCTLRKSDQQRRIAQVFPDQESLDSEAALAETSGDQDSYQEGVTALNKRPDRGNLNRRPAVALLPHQAQSIAAAASAGLFRNGSGSSTNSSVYDEVSTPSE